MIARLKRLAVDEAQLGELCRQWQIVSLEVFGSALRDDFGPASDIDLLVTFAPDAHHGLFSLEQIEEELTELFGRKVDLATRRSVEQSHNWIRRNAILSSAVPIYAAAAA